MSSRQQMQPAWLNPIHSFKALLVFVFLENPNLFSDPNNEAATGTVWADTLQFLHSRLNPGHATIPQLHPPLQVRAELAGRSNHAVRPTANPEGFRQRTFSSGSIIPIDLFFKGSSSSSPVSTVEERLEQESYDQVCGLIGNLIYPTAQFLSALDPTIPLVQPSDLRYYANLLAIYIRQQLTMPRSAFEMQDLNAQLEDQAVNRYTELAIRLAQLTPGSDVAEVKPLINTLVAPFCPLDKSNELEAASAQQSIESFAQFAYFRSICSSPPESPALNMPALTCVTLCQAMSYLLTCVGGCAPAPENGRSSTRPLGVAAYPQPTIWPGPRRMAFNCKSTFHSMYNQYDHFVTVHTALPDKIEAQRGISASINDINASLAHSLALLQLSTLVYRTARQIEKSDLMIQSNISPIRHPDRLPDGRPVSWLTTLFSSSPPSSNARLAAPSTSLQQSEIDTARDPLLSWLIHAFLPSTQSDDSLFRPLYPPPPSRSGSGGNSVDSSTGRMAEFDIFKRQVEFYIHSTLWGTIVPE